MAIGGMYPSGRRCGKPCPDLRLTRKEAEKIRGNCFPGRPHGIRAIFLHVQEGRTVDSLGWWARGKGVQASSSVIVDLDGRIVRCVPDDRGPWTNGEVRKPSERGKALLERHPGVNPNVYSVTLEAEGFSAGEHPEAQLRSIAWMCRAWMTRHGLTIEDVCRHSDVDSVGRGHCPGACFERVVEMLRGAA